MRSANIFDPVEIDLDQRVFDGIIPRRSIVKFIQRVYYHALDHHLGVTGPEWASIYLTGSLTTYQYSSTSDCDITVFPDYNHIWTHLHIDPTEARKLLIEMNIHYLDGTFLPGTTHPLQFFTQPPGLYPEDTFQPGLRSGYDLLDNHWVVPPERGRSHDVQKEMPQVFERAAAIAEKMTVMLDAGDYDAARILWHNVHSKRQLDQRAGLGDYSEGNIVYKWLLHEGLFDRIRSELGEYIAKTSVDYSDGLGIGNRTLPADYQFQMPLEVEQRFINAMECPRCGGNLRKKETGTIYCENCGWRPRQTAVDHLWDERVTTKVIYDFDQDRIVLGTQADIPHLTGDAKIVGEYDAGKVTLFEADKQWINPSYFRRLWHVSYPDKELKDVYFRRESGEEYMLRSLPRKRKQSTRPNGYDLAFQTGDRVELPHGGGFGTVIEVESPVQEEDGTNTVWVRVRKDDGAVVVVAADWMLNFIQGLDGGMMSDTIPWGDSEQDYYRTASAEEEELGMLALEQHRDIKYIQLKDGTFLTDRNSPQPAHSALIYNLYPTTKPNQILDVGIFDRDNGKKVSLMDYPLGDNQTGKDFYEKDFGGKFSTSLDQLSYLIESFKNEKWQHVKGEITIDDLKDSKIANGLCHTLALSFQDFAEKNGFKAWLPKKGTGTPEAFGYDDRSITGHAGHYWTYVETDDGTYGVDWTAAQYGYEDVPVVQKLTRSGWIRNSG